MKYTLVEIKFGVRSSEYFVSHLFEKGYISLSAITEMHDRLIVATAIVLENKKETVSLLTCDRNITASGLLTIVW